MRAIYTLLILVSAFTVNATAQDNAKTQELTIKTEVYCDHCDHCESCKPRIETALFEIIGLKQAKLNIKEQTIKVVFNPKKTSAEEIKKTILASGYPADGVQPTPEAHAKLDGCCQKK